MKKALVVSIVAIALVIPAFAVFSLSSEQPVAAPEQILYAVPFEGPLYKEGELLVRFAEGTAPEVSAQVHAMAGARGVKDLGFGMYLVKLPPNLPISEAMALYGEGNGVQVSPNYIRKAQQVFPQDPLFNYQWALNNTGQTGSDSTFDADIDAPEAWTAATGTQDVVVAVIDTGVDYTHPDLAANMWVNTLEIPGNGFDDDNNGYIDDVYGINAITGSGDPMDDYGHGTHVAGIIGAVGNNQIGVAGVNWNVRIMALKFISVETGTGTVADSIECMNYVAMMADRGEPIVAVNASYGGIRQAFTFEAAAIASLQQRGILFIASSGNSAYDNDGFPQFPAGYTLPNLISVAATDAKDRIASFANFGSQRVHLGAPGVNVYSTLLGGDYGPIEAGYSGTSMAAPHVAGAVALLYSNPLLGFDNPVLDWPFVRNRILAGGDLDPYLEGKTATGRRLNLNGSFNCPNREILARLTPATSETITVFDPSDGGWYYYWVIPKRKEITAIYGKDAYGHFFSNPVKVSAIHIDCDDPAGTVSATIGGDRIALADDGVAPDAVAGDGIYAAYWYPPFDTKDLTAKISNRGTSSSSYTDSFTVRVRQTDAVRGDFVADAGKNISVRQGQTALLDGSASSGPLDVFEPLIYKWEQIGGAEITWGTYTIDIEFGPSAGGTKVIGSEITSRSFFTTPNYVNPVQGQPDPNILTFKLTVEKLDENGEPSGLTATDTVKVTVTQNNDGGGGGGTSCFIATAAYGSDDVRHLPILRQFRDQYLLTNPPGRLFVRSYYHFSPPLASFIAKHNSVRALVRVGLLPLFAIAELALATSPAQKLFIIVSLLLAVGFVLMLRRARRQEN